MFQATTPFSHKVVTNVSGKTEECGNPERYPKDEGRSFYKRLVTTYTSIRCRSPEDDNVNFSQP